MTRKHFAQIAVPPVLLLALTATVIAGNWATITLNEVPDYAVAGTALTLTFSVRQHGRTLLPGLRPSISASAANGLSAKASAVAGKSPGEYTTVLTLPKPGEWTIKIASGFNDSTLTLPTLRVIASGSEPPAAFSPMTRGLRLFAGKGCVGCHRHVEVNPESTVDAKLDLTGKRFPQDYLRKFLADPSIKPAEMPKLNLKPDEIEALAAFINKLAVKTRG